jgi:hypothetical protein
VVAGAGGMSNAIVTATGRRVDPFNPRVEDIDIIDIATALSNICRYGGHVRRFYSVAEHSLHVAWRLPRELRLDGLLHDAAEAYLGDIPRPIKKAAGLAGWREAEAAVERAVARRFGIRYPMHSAVREIDDRIILDEWAALKVRCDDIGVTGEPLGIPACIIGQEGPVKSLFLDLFYDLSGEAPS